MQLGEIWRKSEVNELMCNNKRIIKGLSIFVFQFIAIGCFSIAVLFVVPALCIRAAGNEVDYTDDMEPLHVIEVDEDAFVESTLDENDSLIVEHRNLNSSYSWKSYASTYCYSQMTESERKLYNLFETDGDVLLNGSVDLVVYKGNYYTRAYNYLELGLTQSQAMNVAWAFYMENPQFYFYKNEILKNDSSVCLCVYPGFANQWDRNTATKAVFEALYKYEEILDDDFLHMSYNYYSKLSLVYEKERRIEELIFNMLSYGGNEYGQSLYGALVDNGENDGLCVTESAGYAKLYSVLSNHYGIDTTVLSYTNQSSGDGHVWNKTKLNDSWYNVDVAWDDTAGQKYKYLNKSDATYLADSHMTYLNSPYVSIYSEQWIPKALGDYDGHDWGLGTVTVKPTCTKNGEETFTCSDCGKTRTESIPATGHSISNWKTVRESTVKLCGYEEGKCIYCNEVFTRELPLKQSVSMDSVYIYADTADKVYSGEETTLGDISVLYNGKSLIEGTDYKIQYENNVNAGIATAIITGQGDYTGTKRITYGITPKNIEACSINELNDVVFNNQLHKPTIVIRDDDRKCNLMVNKDYLVGYTDNLEVGKATVTISGYGNYKGTIHLFFNILPIDISNCEVNGIVNKVYTGQKLTQQGLSVVLESNVLEKDQDYSVSYKNNKSVGSATMVIVGKGNYAGTITKSFKILPKGTTIKKLMAGSTAFKVTWTPQKTKMTSSYITGYQIQYSKSKNFESGNKYVNVTKYSSDSKTIASLKKGDKYFVRIRTFIRIADVKYFSTWSESKSIVLKTGDYSIEDTEISVTKAMTYTGKRILPKVKVMDSKTLLKEGEDYEIEVFNNVGVTTVATVTINGKGLYEGTSDSRYFKILPKGTSIKSLKAGNKSMKISWVKQSAKMKQFMDNPERIDYYEIQYSKSASFSSKNQRYVVKGYNKTSVEIKNMNPGKYYVRIRTCFDGSYETVYSTWSDKMSVTVK